MNLLNKLQLSIQSRFHLATGLSVASFIVIGLILLLAFVQVRGNIRQVVGTQFQQVVDVSYLSRELGQFLIRLKLVEGTFLGNDEFLQQEGQALPLLLEQQKQFQHGDELQRLYPPLQEKLAVYLRQCAIVNELFQRRSQVEGELNETFTIIEDILAERIVVAALRGEAVDYYEQLTLLTAGYRVELLEIIKLNEHGARSVQSGSEPFHLSAGSTAISKLKLQVKTLTAAKWPLNRVGRHLIDQLSYYQHLLERYQHETVFLEQCNAELTHFSEQLLGQIDALVRQHSAAAVSTVQEIDQTLWTTALVVFVLLLVLALLLRLIHQRLFQNHVMAPMALIRKRLLQLHAGDYRSPMALTRNDEWGQVEELFNSILADLVRSWADVQESERRYRNIFDSANEGIFQSTVEGAFLNINPALYAMLGLAQGEGLTQFDNLREQVFACPADRDQMISQLLETATVTNYEVEMRRTNGEIFWASINCHLVRDQAGKVSFIEGTVEDISQRRQAEDALRELKEYLSDIVNTMPSVLIGVSPELEITLWNRQAEQVSGTSFEQAAGQSLADVPMPMLGSFYLPAVQETLASGKISRVQKVPGQQRCSGRFFDLLIYPLHGPGTGGVVIHMEDVTEKAQIEGVMVQSEKMISVGNLAAGMAHEINNPLAAVLQNVQVLGQRLSPSLDKNRQTAAALGMTIEQVAEYAHQRGFDQMLQGITAAGQRAAQIIENMLNFSRKSSSSFIPCSVTDLLEKTLELAASDYDMKHHFDFRTINVIREYQNVPDVPCEASQIQQVLLNLLKNSAQAIGTENRKPEIRLRVFLEGDFVCLQVEDNGIGMDDETCRRVFEPFYSTREVGLGTGLGLSVCYFLITETHKGRLTVSSQPGKGSCFSILLPLVR